MFTKDERIKGRDVETVIGPSVKVKGDFVGQGDIIIEGFLEGTLKTVGNLFVGQNAEITASVHAKEGKISGKVVGNIKMSGFLEITATAHIDGNILAGQLSVERGAVINGQLSMKESGTKVTTNENVAA
ncbi:MAG: polymer-forming cytoskeletal protein [Candidatus Falkowbacteria bacterium]